VIGICDSRIIRYASPCDNELAPHDSDSAKCHFPVEYDADLTPVVEGKEGGASWNARGMEKTVDFSSREEYSVRASGRTPGKFTGRDQGQARRLDQLVLGETARGATVIFPTPTYKKGRRSATEYRLILNFPGPGEGGETVASTSNSCIISALLEATTTRKINVRAFSEVDLPLRLFVKKQHFCFWRTFDQRSYG
jgi:hypothetical protein